MDGSETKTRRNCWIERSELEKGLLVLLVIATLLISTLGILLFLYTMTKTDECSSSSRKGLTGGNNSDEFCDTTACLESALEILSRIDTNVDPCEDFYAFSCNNIGKDVDLDNFYDEYKLERARIEVMFREPVQDNDHPLVKVQKTMFEACMNETEVAEDAYITIQEVLRTVGGWPVLEEKWNEAKFDWVQTSYKLRQLGYTFSSYLDVNIVPDPNNTQKYIFQVSIPEVNEVYSKWFDSDEPVGFMTSVATAFGAPTYRAMAEMTEMHQFLKNLQWLWNNSRTENENSFRRATVEQFQRREKDVKWIEFINTIVGPYAHVSNKDEVLFPLEGVLDGWLGILRNTPKRTLANYMLWRVVEEGLPFLTEQLKNGRVRPRLMANSKWKNRAEFCIEEIGKRFFPSPIHVMEIRNILPEEKKQAVEEVADNIKNELMDVLKEIKWLDSNEKKAVLNTVKNRNIVAGALQNYFDDGIFDKMAIDLNISGNNFLNMLTQANRNQKDRLYGLIGKSPAETFTVYSGFVFNALIVEMGDHVMGVAYLHNPNFNHERPNYINYASAGIITGNLLPDMLGSLSNKTKKILEENEKCVIHSAAPENVPEFENNLVSTLAGYKRGMKIANQAYKKWAKDNEELPLLLLDYTPEQLFWISSGYFFCRYAYYYGDLNDLDSNSKEAYSLLVSKVVNSSPDLAQDFGCPEVPEPTCQFS